MNLSFIYEFIPLEIPYWRALTLQDSASPLIEQLIYFHDYVIIFLLIILIFLLFLMIDFIFNKFTIKLLSENQRIELIWTFLPIIILLFIALPSLRLLYLIDEINSPRIRIKIIGHQWFWSYEYRDFINIEFDSYIVNRDENAFTRLLDVDNRLVLPINSQIRLLTSSVDVIHSWTIPVLGVKADALPGRLNQIRFIINRISLFYGQCSEICGANHSFIPIVVECVPVKIFINWLKIF